MKQFTHLYTKILCLLCILLTFGANSVWGAKRFYAQCAVESKPAVGGYVSIWRSAQEDDTYSFVTETTDQTGTQESGLKTNSTSSATLDFYGYQRAATGYTFQYWSTDPNATSGITAQQDHWYNWWSQNCKYYNLQVTSTSTNNNSPTIWKYYAFFTPNTYTVNFNANGGTVTPSSKTVTYDAPYGTLPAEPAVSRAGYTFAGWWTSATGGTEVTATTPVKITSEQTLYAHWTANSYTITLNSDLATSHGTESLEVTYDQNTNLTSPISTPSRDRWTYWGYYTREDGKGTKLIDRNGNVLANVSGYTDENKNWKYADYLILYAHITEKLDQTIIWNLTAGQEYATGTLMDATATSGLTPVTYSSNHPEWGYINENNRLVVVEPNRTITITASQKGDDYYNPAPDVQKEIITLGANPNQYTEVTASDITYGDLLGTSTLSGNVYLDGVEIAGTLSWVDSMIMPNAGTAEHMVLFTPDNELAYSSVYFEVPVVVEKATPTITWNISSALRENTIYNNIAVSSNREEALTLTEESDYLSISGLVLTIGEIGETETSPITITAHQEESANYKEVTSIQTITIYPKVAQCLPVDIRTIDDTLKIQNMGAVYTGTYGWCTETEIGKGWYITDVKYTQYYGWQLGGWREGLSGTFSGLKELAGAIKDGKLPGTSKSLELKFNGVPESLSFETKLQEVSFDLGIFGGWKTAEQDNPTWTVYQKSIRGIESIVGSYSASSAGTISVALADTTRAVRIEINSAFAGFIQNLTITQKQYIHADQAELVFGSDTPHRPLQESQNLRIDYSSIGNCEYQNDTIVVTAEGAAFYVDKDTIYSNVGIDQTGQDSVRVRCNDINKSGNIIFRSIHSGVELSVPVSSTKPAISASTAATKIFQTGTEHAPVAETAYRALRTHNFSACFDDEENAIFDALYIYGVSESSAADRQWSYDAYKGYNVPTISASNVHTPCFVYKKDGKQYTYDHTFDASTETLNIADGKKHIFVGYKPECSAATAIQVNGANTELYLNNTEIIASGAPLAINATSAVYANGVNIISSTGNAAVQLSEATTLTVEDTWTGDATSAILALRPAASYPSIDLGSASGRVDVNGTQLTLRNATNMAIAHMEGTIEHFDGEVHINDGSVGGEATLGMPKNTFIDGGTFNDGTVVAYTLKGMPKRPRNSRGDMLSRHTMSKDALASAYSWYGQAHLTQDGASKVNPMLMDEVVWIFTGDAGESYDEADSWNKDGVPGENDDVLINAPMVISGGEMKLHGITINWVDGEHGVPAITVKPDGGLTVGEDGVDGASATNLVLRADQNPESTTKGQTGYLRIHPASAEPMPEATVEMFSIGYYNKSSEEENIAAWQYVGAPIQMTALAKTVFTRSWIYSYVESEDKWVNNRAKLVMEPFVGYSTTQYDSEDGKLLAFAGTLVQNHKNHISELVYTDKDHGHNMLANSYAAPIDVTKMRTTDFVNAEPTIYLFNTGSLSQAHARAGTKGNMAGQFIPITIGSLKAMEEEFEDESVPTTIAAMQGFSVNATAPGATVTFDYERLVWNANYSKHQNRPLYAPASSAKISDNEEQEDEAIIRGALMLNIEANGWSDNCYLLESDSYESAFEMGFDASKMFGGNLNIFTLSDTLPLAINATNTIVGTRIGVRAGEETTYSMSFSHLRSEHDLLLFDAETTELIGIYDGLEYTFNVEPNTTVTERFIILEREKTPEVTTAIENAAANSVKVRKFIKDNQLYILKNGVLYNATGARVH